MDFTPPFNHWLKQRRLQLNLTQADLARRAGYATITLRKLESGELRPSRQLADRLADILDIPTTLHQAFVDFAAGAASYRPPHNLPAPPNPLIGRARELAELARLLRRPDVRLVTLAGPPGVGKTRLALQAAADLLDAHPDACPDGAWLVNLAPLASPNAVAQAIVESLSFTTRPDEPLNAGLKRYLRDRQLLLVLDNFEHLLDAAPFMAELLATALRLKVLATSRAALNLSTEHIYDVPPLALPDCRQALNADALAGCASIELFVRRAQSVQAGFALVPECAPDVVEICRRLDGLPLAIELAAARLRRLTPSALLAALDHPADYALQVLAGGPRDLPARQQTMCAAVDWSYSLLGEDEKVLFRHLGVFTGGFTIDAVRSAFPHLQSLISNFQSLLDHSLVQPVALPAEEERYTLLEVIREFTLDKLAEAGELDAARRAHAIAFCELAEEAEPHIHDREQQYWVAKLEREHNNIRAVLGWSLSPGADTQLGLRLASHMWLFWKIRNAAEGSQWLQRLIAAAGALSPSLVLGRAYLGHSCLLIVMESPEPPRATLEEAIRLLTLANDREGAAFALYILGALCPDDNRVQELVQEGMALESWRGNRIGMEWAVYWYLHCRHFWEAYQGLGKMIDDLIESASARGDRQLQSFALMDKGFSAMYRNEMTSALVLMKQALGTARTIGADWEITVSLYRLGEILELTGELDGAQRCEEEALRLAARNSWPDNAKIVALSVLGKVARDRGDYATAQDYFAQSLALSLPGYQWWGLEGMSCVAAALGQHMRAARLLGAAEADRQRRNDPWWEKDKLDLAPYIDMARAGLSEEAYGAAYAEGQAMSLTEAKSYALAESNEVKLCLYEPGR